MRSEKGSNRTDERDIKEPHAHSFRSAAEALKETKTHQTHFRHIFEATRNKSHNHLLFSFLFSQPSNSTINGCFTRKKVHRCERSSRSLRFHKRLYRWRDVPHRATCDCGQRVPTVGGAPPGRVLLFISFG